ncbi:MAG TPA: hypothetical protein VF916_08555, partial [Ktedonobacterales bacterium]
MGRSIVRAPAQSVRPAQGALRELPCYRVPGDGLEMGASFGNAKCWVTTRGNGDIERLFSVDLGMNVYGALALRYAAPAAQPAASSPTSSMGTAPAVMRGARRLEEAQTPLSPQGPGEFKLHPAYQRRTIELPNRLHLSETIFVPKTSGPERSVTYDGPVVYQLVEIENGAPQPQRVTVYGYAQLRGQTPLDMIATFDPGVRSGALLAHNASHPDWVRLFGLAGDGQQLSGYATTLDAIDSYALTAVYPLQNAAASTGDLVGVLQVDIDLAPGGRRRFGFVAVFSVAGAQEARRLFAHAWDIEAALADTVAYYTRMASISEVMTPDATLNEGVVWAKANMLRVMADFPRGRAFTNDPGVSSHVVGRDAAWFTYGCDYLLPEFSRALLDSFAARQDANGKIIEYYDAITDARTDYGLNINDNTPLFIVAVDHHYRVTGDARYVERIYPVVARAAQYLLSQLDTNL